MFRRILEGLFLWIAGVLGIREDKHSAVVLTLFITLAMIGWELKYYQVVDDNLLYLALTCLGIIGGLNLDWSFLPPFRKKDV